MTDHPHFPLLDDGGSPAAARPEQEAARWWTFAATAAPDAVAAVIRQALAASPRKGKGAIEGARLKDGYVLRLRVGRKEVALELRLTGWEGGTRIHVILPETLKGARERECAERLQALLGSTAVRDEAQSR